MFRIILTLITTLCLAVNCQPKDEVIGKPFTICYDVPYLENISIDGLGDDWEGKGTRISLYCNNMGQVTNTEDLSIEFSMGWDSTGLLFYFDIKDDTIFSDWGHIWTNDLVSIYMADSFGSKNMVQYTIGPSHDESKNGMLANTGDYRTHHQLRKSLPVKDFAVSINRNGYSIEARLHFKDLGLSPKKEIQPAVQVFVADYDKKIEDNVITYSWHYGSQAYLTPLSMNMVRLSKVADTIPSIAVKSFLKNDSLHFIARGDTSLLHMVHSGGKEFIFDSDSMGKLAYFAKPYRASDKKPVEIYCNDEIVGIIHPYNVYIKDKTPENRFETEIRYFEAYDVLFPYREGKILFVGSSSFRKWHTLSEDMAGLEVLNRGFGGSTMQDVLHYYDRLIIPYKPSIIVIYEGDNDIPRGVKPITFANQCKTFIEKTKEILPGTKIYFVSIKPSPSRWHYQAQYIVANDELKALVNEYEDVEFIDVFSQMIDKGKARKDIFTNDNLHMNDEGYRIWTEVILKNLTGL